MTFLYNCILGHYDRNSALILSWIILLQAGDLAITFLTVMCKIPGLNPTVGTGQLCVYCENQCDIQPFFMGYALGRSLLYLRDYRQHE